MRWLLVFALSGCISDRTIELELRPPRAPDGGPLVPDEVRRHELRLYRVDDGEGCPDAATAASAAPFGVLAHAQSFADEDAMGEPIGELPRGVWAIAAISRDVGCAPRLFGCTEVAIADAPSVVIVDLENVAIDATCGCRACEAGVCAPVERECF